LPSKTRERREGIFIEREKESERGKEGKMERERKRERER